MDFFDIVSLIFQVGPANVQVKTRRVTIGSYIWKAGLTRAAILGVTVLCPKT